MYYRYAEILTRSGPEARDKYAALRRTLLAGGGTAEIYRTRLTVALSALDRVFGDTNPALWSCGFRWLRLNDAAPLWTAASLDRCLVLALLYPITTVLVLWAVSGHVGPAERAFSLPDPTRTVMWFRCLNVAAALIVLLTGARCSGATFWRGLAWGAVAGFISFGIIILVALVAYAQSGVDSTPTPGVAALIFAVSVAVAMASIGVEASVVSSVTISYCIVG